MAALGASIAAIAIKLASARLRQAPTEAAKPGTR
jgi:hypothetical protein